MEKRIHNFNAGPAALPLPVLQEMQSELLDFKGSGMSILEVSHRSKWFDEVINEAVERTRRLLGLSDDFEVLFLQGGASLQFCLVPMNLSLEGKPVDYINTGTWSTKAIKEAQIQGKDVRVIASSEEKGFPSSRRISRLMRMQHTFTSLPIIRLRGPSGRIFLKPVASLWSAICLPIS